MSNTSSDYQITDLTSIDSIDKATIESITKLSIRNYESYNDVKTFDISIFSNLTDLTLINHNGRLAIIGLDKCLQLKKLSYGGVKFDTFSSQLLEYLTVNDGIDDDFDPTAFPQLKSVIFGKECYGELDISKLSVLTHLETCDMLGKFNVTGTLTSESIKHLKYQTISDEKNEIVFDLPNLISYEGKLNRSILTKCRNIESINLTDEISIMKHLICSGPEYPKLTELKTFATCDVFSYFIGRSNITKLTLYLNAKKINIKNLVHCSNWPSFASIKSLTLHYYEPCNEISKIVNIFKSLDELRIIGNNSDIKYDIVCPIKRIYIDTFRKVNITRFNTSILSVLSLKDRSWDGKSWGKVNVPTLTELYCGEYILAKENEPNIKIYHGPFRSEMALINAEKIDYSCGRYDPDFSKMPKLKMINGRDAKEFFAKNASALNTNKRPADRSIQSNSKHRKLDDEVMIDRSTVDPIESNIVNLLTGHIYHPGYNSYIKSKFNHSYHFVSSVSINSIAHPTSTIGTIVNAITQKLIETCNDIESVAIIAKMNAVFKNHELDEARVIMEQLLLALNGAFGITMDTKKYELIKKVDELQKQLDQMKASQLLSN